MSDVQAFTTPVGELQWIFITGKGKKDPKGNDRFVASVVFPTDSDECQELTAKIDEFWQDFKPKAAKKANALGYRKLEDEEGNATGFTSFNFWTGTEFKDGQPKVVQVFNSKGNEVSLGSKKVGNGSRGRIKGAMAIFNVDANKGVTLFLNGIQLSKFIPFEGGVSFDSVEDDDGDGFEGFDENGMDSLPSESENPAPQPRL